MSMSLGQTEGDEPAAISEINTTPLVDVMLVMLIIFLITIPVITRVVKVDLPKAVNIPTQTKPENVSMSVTAEGKMYWNGQEVPNLRALTDLVKVEAVKVPQPEIHIRGDQETRYENVNTVVQACQRAGIVKVGFITEPPPRG